MRSRSESPKPYYGCESCQLKYNVKGKESINKLPRSPPSNILVKRRSKIKITDLCDDDKKKIVDLIEELAKYTEDNKILEDRNVLLESERQDQEEQLRDTLEKHLSEKTFFLKEIESYKSRLEVLESKMKQNALKWESHSQVKETEISHLSKLLSKSKEEKALVEEEVKRLSLCLKHSLESFELLQKEIRRMQQTKEDTKPVKHAKCQTDQSKQSKKKTLSCHEGCRIVANDKVEKNCKKGKSLLPVPVHPAPEKIDKTTDPQEGVVGENEFQEKLSQMIKDEMEKILGEKAVSFNVSKSHKDLRDLGSSDDSDQLKLIHESNTDHLLKPNNCYRTSSHARRILDRIGKSFDFPNEKNQKLRENYPKNADGFPSYMRTMEPIVPCKKERYEDDERVLKDLFYIGNNYDIDLESVFLADSEKLDMRRPASHQERSRSFMA